MSTLIKGIRAGLSALVIGAAGMATVGVASAGAAPLAIYQIPATALTVSGLVVPGPYFATVTATPTQTSGQAVVSASARPEICSSSAGAAIVKVNYVNLHNGRAGEVSLRPCPYFLDPAPTETVINPGAGQIVFSIRVRGTDYRPTAGQPSLPGVGTFSLA